MSKSEIDTNWSDIFKRIRAGEKIHHRDVDPKFDCGELLSVKKTQTGGIETLGIWCPKHEFLETGFVDA